jgi:[protein-PII] uridylyltransferase
MTIIDHPPHATGELLDTAVVSAELARLAEDFSGRDRELRTAVAQRLKAALADARIVAEQLLLEDRHGRRCAERLCRLQDDLIGVLYDFAVRRLYPPQTASDAEHMAIVATGGYGRGLMAPGSDIDLLFLLPYKQTAWGESVAEAILYCLWDMGLKVGHATRSVDECIRQAKADMTIRTAVLEARFLLGDRKLYDQLVARFDKQVAQGTAAEFVTAKLAEREERHRRAGQSRYLVEPNVKDGKGGLRDLHTLFWMAKYVYRVREPEELIEHGVFDRQEYQLFRRCEDFLWAVRCHMHFVTGRAEERLSFDLQRDIAIRLGYTSHPGLRDVERFMKHYFLMAKDVGDLTAILCAELEARQAKGVAMLNRVVARFRRRPRRVTLDAKGFIVDHNRISVADPQVFERDPVNLIRIFHLAQRHSLDFHPDAMRLATRSLKLIDKSVREDAEANRLFLEILTAKNDTEVVLRRMNEAGVLGRFIPDFGRIVSMMQFNMYHHYTVDEHLLRCIGVLAEIEAGKNEEYGLANELVRTIKPEHRVVLHVALFLHDIAKGRVEDHSIGGARIARKLGPRFGLSAANTEILVWLIEQHLTMSSIAQSRDLSDRRTIENFVAVVQSLERMKLLTILTTADIRAVGPGVWNGWKAQLLRALYYETEPALTGGFSEVDRARRVAMAQAEFRAEMKEWEPAEIDRYAARHYPAYWLKVDVPRKVAHARFLRSAELAGKTLATAVSYEAGVTILTVLAPDHPWLLSVIAGACAAGGANIVDAQIFTTTDGLALDTISVTREFELDDDEGRRAIRIADAIERALRGDLKLPEVVAKRAAPKGRIKAFAVEPEVSVNNAWSNRYTVVEMSGLDRPGLLYELTTALSKLNLNIASAHVATFGERAVDVFYVTDLLGAKIFSPTRHAAIKRALIAMFAGGTDGQPARSVAAG